MDVAEIIAGLSPALRKKILMGSEFPKPEYAKTPSPSLNKALGGGFVYGRQVLVWGNKSASKSSTLLQLIALAQAVGKVCAWIDAESSFDPKWATTLGVDITKLIVSKAQTINDMVDVGTQLMKAGVDIIVVDSISSLLPAIYFEKDSNDLKDLVDTKQIGAEARDMTNAVKMLNYANQGHTLLILISQTRNSFGSMHASLIPTGGKAVQFYSSTIVKLFSSESENQAIKKKLHIGDKVVEQTVGREVNWDITFNKTAAGFRSGKFHFYFAGNHIGVDTVNDAVDLAIGEGIITGKGWYSYGETKIQGKESMVDWFRDNPDKLVELEAQLV
jgi:recombination protein RecA